MRNFYFVLILIIGITASGFQSSCPGRDPNKAARTAEEQFALTTSRLAEHVGQAMRVVEGLVDNGLLSPKDGVALIDKLLNINHVNKLLIISGQQFVVNVNGVRTLRFTEDGRLELEKLARALTAATKAEINDPLLVRIDPKARSQLTAVTEIIEALAARLLTLIINARKITVSNPAYIETNYGTGNFATHRVGLEIVGFTHTSRTATHRQERG